MKAPQIVYLPKDVDLFARISLRIKQKGDVEYIRKDISDEAIQIAEDHAYFAGQEKFREKLLEWAKEMKRICQGAEPIEKAYQTMIDKIESL